MQLWTGILSPFSAKVRMVIGELGVDCEFIDLPWSRENRWDPKPEAFLNVSPRGEVPALVVEGQGIFDSTIILEYLAEAFPSQSLMPSTPLERANCRMQEDLADHLVAGPVVTLISEVFLKPDGKDRDTAAANAAFAAIHHYQNNLEQRLGHQDYLCNEFTSADIAAFVALGFATTLDAPIPKNMPRLTAWWQRLNARPAIGEDFATMMQAAAQA